MVQNAQILNINSVFVEISHYEFENKQNVEQFEMSLSRTGEIQYSLFVPPEEIFYYSSSHFS